jgi:two-component system, LytTR family, sensor kinase
VDDLWPVLALAAVAVLVGLLLAWLVRHRHDFGTPADRATYQTLHTASLASPPLRGGLNHTGAERSIRFLRALLGTPAVALTDLSSVLSWNGAGEHHGGDALRLARPVIAEGHTLAHGPKEVRCDVGDCPLRHCIVAPLTVEDRVVGTL